MAERLPKAYLPRAGRRAALRVGGFRTLDRRGGARGGTLRQAAGIDPRHLPELTTLPTPTRLDGIRIEGIPLSLHAIENDLYATANVDGTVRLTRIRDGVAATADIGTSEPDLPRCVARFTYYGRPNEPLVSSTYPKAVILPDGKYCRLDEEALTVYKLARKVDGVTPPLTQACVHLSRLFGVRGDRLYASCFNTAGIWDYDEEDDISAGHAWVTTSQSGGRTNGDFTGITVYGGQVLAFKEGACQAVSGTANPFRITQLLSVGAVDGRSIAEAGGYLLFAGRGNVYRFDGDRVEEIGDVLSVSDFAGSVGAAAGGLYYLYVPAAGCVFVYSTDTGAWCTLSPFTSAAIVAMSATDTACYFLDAEGGIYTTAGGVAAAFLAEGAPLLPETAGAFRLFRLRLTLTAEAGASLSVLYRDTGGRETPLLSFTGVGGTARVISRTLSPADYGGSLLFSGRGDIRIHSVELVTQTGETDE